MPETQKYLYFLIVTHHFLKPVETIHWQILNHTVHSDIHGGKIYTTWKYFRFCLRNPSRAYQPLGTALTCFAKRLAQMLKPKLRTVLCCQMLSRSTESQKTWTP